MSEADHQTAFFEWLEFFPKLRPFVFAIPNGGYRHPREAVRLKAQGVTRGIPDVFCSIPNHEFHGLYLEFKFGKNKLTNEQAQMFERFKRMGYACEAVYDWEVAREILIKYLGRQHFDQPNPT
jgi:hypothetical protein